MCKHAYSSLNAAEHRGNKPETHRLARRTRNPPRPRKAKASSGIDRPRKGKTISQMPFARGASKKSTNKPRKPWRHNGTSQSATQGCAPVRLGLSGPALWVPQVGISLCRTTRKARDLTDLPP